MVICPVCKGAKRHTGIGCGPGGSRSISFPCVLCRGAGEITPEQVEWVLLGERLREMRRDRRLTGREAARLCGVTPSAWSNAEFGRTNPDTLIDRLSQEPLP